MPSGRAIYRLQSFPSRLCFLIEEKPPILEESKQRIPKKTFMSQKNYPCSIKSINFQMVKIPMAFLTLYVLNQHNMFLYQLTQFLFHKLKILNFPSWNLKAAIPIKSFKL